MEDLVREKGRIGKNNLGKAQKLYGQKTGKKHKKTGLISGYAKLPNAKKYCYIAPWIYDCNCDTVVFNTWLQNILIPEINLIKKAFPGNPITLIMDNVAYHKSQKTRDILEKNKINLKFQPPYSPDLNPIEHSWTHTKNDIRNDCKNLFFYDKLCSSLNTKSWTSL